jgi:hypothetical protein
VGKNLGLVRAKEFRRIPLPPSGNYRFLGVTRSKVYAIYDDGRVWSISRGRFLKQNPDSDGYPKVDNCFVHRLILLAFKGQPTFPHAEGRHLDGMPENCRLENLAWGTRKENWADRKRHGRVCAGLGESNRNHKLTERQVLKIRKSTRSNPSLAAEFGVCNETVRKIKKGIAWNHLKPA